MINNLSSGSSSSRIRRRNENDRNNSITDLTFLGGGTSSITSNNIGGGNSSSYLCEFCDIPLIKKMDDIKLLGTQDAGTAVNTRFICPRCGNIKDPLKVADFDKLKRVERGQTIRNNNSGGAGGSEEGTPFVEMVKSNTTDDKGSLRKGTQVSRALSQTDINGINDPEPNEDSIMRGQNMRILRTETTYPESGRKVVKTYDD